MRDDTPRTKEEGLRRIEAAEAEVAKKEKLNERLVEEGGEAFERVMQLRAARHRQARQWTDEEMERLGPAGDAIAHQLQLIKDEMYARPGFGDAIQAVADDLIDAHFWIDPDDTGQIMVWLTIGDCTYWRGYDGELLVIREVEGVSWWTEVLSDGQLGEWQAMPPHRGRLN